MARLIHIPYDCSVPYNRFQDLKDGDIIYFIDFKSIELKRYIVENINIKEVPEWDDRKNCLEVELVISGFDEDRIQRIANGNNYIYEFYLNGNGYFFTTDERIGKSILNIIRSRNAYQFDIFNHIFGKSNSYFEFKDQDIKIK